MLVEFKKPATFQSTLYVCEVQLQVVEQVEI